MKFLDVSIVIPAYGAEQFIDSALNSVQNQTIFPKEVIVVDDGSLDNTSAVVMDWIGKVNPDFEVKLIRQVNGGISSARNCGIRLASSNWIALFDADDIWENNHLEVLFSSLDFVPGAVASYGAGRLLAGGRVDVRLYDEFWDNPSKNLGVSIPGTASYMIDFRVFPRLICGNFIKPSSLMFDRKIATKVGLFDENLRSAEDREFLIRMLRQGVFVYTPTPITQYRWHENNLSQSKNSKTNVENGLRVLKIISENNGLMLKSSDIAALSKAQREMSREYSYCSSLAGRTEYLKNMQWLSKMFGPRNLLNAITVKHLLRIFLGRARP